MQEVRLTDHEGERLADHAGDKIANHAGERLAGPIMVDIFFKPHSKH